MNSKAQKAAKPSPEVNLAPGFGVLALSVAVTVTGFAAGAQTMPFGGVAIAACVFSAIQMIQRQSVAPGYASFFIVAPAIAAAILVHF